MIHYILADLKRITRRIPVLVCTVLIIAMLVFVFLSSYYTQDWNSIDFGRILQLFLNYAPIFVGLFVFISVFWDDFFPSPAKFFVFDDFLIHTGSF